ncbi:MAG: N-formylglutamate deformylase [Steroidobacteraceae bacterium]
MSRRAHSEAEPLPPAWLEIRRGRAPLLVSFPHTGTDIPGDIEQRLISPWLARKDTDWWVHLLYAMAHDLDATTLRTTISRSVIDVNRDPSGASLYPGRATTELCALATFDGEPLYRGGDEPDAAQIAARRARYFEPYHAALAAELKRLEEEHGVVVLYDAHSIRSRVPRLFEGTLPHFNIGTHDGRSCDPALTRAVEHACEHPSFSRVTNGRFKGGWTVRHHGRPREGAHAVQMELACRVYMDEPDSLDQGRPQPLSADNWPSAFDAARAAHAREVLARALEACVRFARIQRGGPT